MLDFIGVAGFLCTKIDEPLIAKARYLSLWDCVAFWILVLVPMKGMNETAITYFLHFVFITICTGGVGASARMTSRKGLP